MMTTFWFPPGVDKTAPPLSSSTCLALLAEAVPRIGAVLFSHPILCYVTPTGFLNLETTLEECVNGGGMCKYIQHIQHFNVTYLPHYYVLIFVYFRYFPPFHRRKDAMTLQLITAQHQLGTSLVVELRGDVQALGLGERIAR